jgi:aryl carrier-like protein
VILQITTEPDVSVDDVTIPVVACTEPPGRTYGVNHRNIAVQAIVESSQRQAPTSNAERLLHSIWCEALKTSEERISVNDGFRQLGGDSITAIDIVARSRRQGLSISVQDVFKSQTIADLAKKVQMTGVTGDVESSGLLFELSPIQKLVMDGKERPENHHAMSFLLRLREQIDLVSLESALRLVVNRHPMLRARFVKTGGSWLQKISTSIDASFRAKSCARSTMSSLQPVFKSAQEELDVQTGPLSIAMLCHVKGQSLLFLSIHHLVVDPVSCQILLRDLQRALQSGHVPQQEGTSYQSWLAQQALMSRALTLDDCIPYKVPRSNYGYWAMEDSKNLAGEAIIHYFTLAQPVTESLTTARTPVLDILIAAAFCAVAYCFPDREDLPAIFTDSHGREPWLPDQNILDTVGWFTSVYPLAIQPGVEITSICKVLEHIQVLRCVLPRSGSNYMCARWLNSEGQNAFAKHFPMEIMCHYYGSTYRELDTSRAFFSRVGSDDLQLHQAADQFEVLALLSVFAENREGQLRVGIGYSKRISRQDQIRTWFEKIEELLIEIASLDVIRAA